MTRVLAVDDEPDILAIVEGVLGANGHQAMISTDPTRAVDLAIEHQAEVIILDVNMPDLSGFETLKALRSNHQTADLPILFLSALGDAEHKIQGLRQGADDYLAKPFAGDELVLRVERLGVRTKQATASPGSSTEVIEKALRTGDFLSHRVFFGRYQALEIIGRGGMGLVLRALDPTLKRAVALKTVRLESLSLEMETEDQLVGQLMQEAGALARFSHPNIVAVYDVGICAQNTAYIVMELVEGVSLGDLLAAGPLNTSQAVHLCGSVAKALATAHAEEMIHRDIKPGNILLSYGGDVKVTDFGLSNTVSSLAEEHKVFGTPGFIPPECFIGDSYGFAGDVFGLGAILYLCLTGVPAFSGKTLPELLTNTVLADPIPPSELQPEIPRDLNYLVLRMLQGEPEARPSAAEVEQDLTHCMASCSPDWDQEHLRALGASNDGEQSTTYSALVIDTRLSKAHSPQGNSG